MDKTIKFGQPNKECPHCCGNAHEARFEVEERSKARSVLMNEDLHRAEATVAIRAFAQRGLKGSEHKEEIQAALEHQARIEQINHGGWPIEIQAWANVCPDCDVVTEYRAIPSAAFRFGWHGPTAERSRCAACQEKAAKA